MKTTRSTIIFITLAMIAASMLAACLPNAPTEGMATPPQPVSPTAPITSTSDPCAPGNIRTSIIELDRLTREFRDAFDLAKGTAATQLSPIISQMQEIRRRAEDYASPPCLAALREYQLGFMNTAIDTSLLLYSSLSGDPNQTLTEEQINTIVGEVNRRMAQATDFENRYTIEAARLLGITLTPSPTLDPANLPATAGATATP